MPYYMDRHDLDGATAVDLGQDEFGVEYVHHGKGFHFGPQRAMRLKGFDEPVRASEVTWQMPLEG